MSNGNEVVGITPATEAEVIALSRAEILSFTHLTREPVTIPEWGGKTVWVRELTAEERDDYEGGMLRAKHKGRQLRMEPNFKNAKARMVSKCTVDAQGTRLFGEADIPALGRLSAAALDRIVDVAQRLSGMGREDVEEQEGNSSTGQGDDSPSV